MKKINKAKVVGAIGLIGMFIFPSPQQNFLYYLSFIVLIIAIIVYILKFSKNKEKLK